MVNLDSADQARTLLAELKQDEKDTTSLNESKATQEHIAGAQGKLASAISQQEGDSDINEGGRRVAREVEASGEDVDRDALQQSLREMAKEKISGNEMNLEKGSEAARLQSAAEQYDLAREGKHAASESHLDKP